MKVFVKGKHQVELKQSDYLGAGGEGTIYARGGTAYKLYHDPTKMIAPNKIQELSSLTQSNIIRPLDVLLDDKNTPIGYSMRHISTTNALCQTFTKAFRDRNKITNDTIVNLVQNMQQTVNHVHQHNVLIVDLNEMNFLIDDKFKEVYFIDVDSWQTPHYPATAIMESVRDRHCNGKWTKETDWFSFGIVSFQMFVGIHPYKGKHPTLNGFDERMLANASVFRKDVTYPKVVLPFSVIPQNYLDWYKAVFEDGKRFPPPVDLVATIVLPVQVRKIVGTDNFEIKEVFSLPEEIIDYLNLGVRITQTTKGVYINEKIASHAAHNLEVVTSLTPKMNKVILTTIQNGPKLYNATDKEEIPFTGTMEQSYQYSGRLYYKTGGSLFEMNWLEHNKIIPSPKLVANVHEQATKLYDGVAMQNLLGKHFATITPESGKSYTIALPEVSGQVMDAKFDNNVLMVIASKAKKGAKKTGTQTLDLEYTRTAYRFSPDYSTHDLKQAVVKEFVPLNFVVLDTGICCIINEDENVVLFRNKKDDPLVKIIDDPIVKGDLRLFKNGSQVVFADADTLYSLKLK
jgi:hypothetical protein